MAIADEKYIALTTYRKNGESSSTAVWITDLGDGTVGFVTAGSSLKAKRIRNDNRVKLQASSARGDAKDGSEILTGTAEVVTGDGYDSVKSKIRDKYGWQVGMVDLMAKVAKLFGKDRANDSGIVITLD